MKEVVGDIFEQKDADAICFTSNGIVKYNGELVMGAGIAKKFRDRYPGLAKHIGSRVQKYGNHVSIFKIDDYGTPTIVSFPTKNDWRDQSDLDLIIQSCHELVKLVDNVGWKKIYLPRPGCGLGELKWEDVKKAIEPILDDRFFIISL